MLIGDSLTEYSFRVETIGWGLLLTEWFARSHDIMNRGFGGYNSRWLAWMVPKFLSPNNSNVDNNIVLATILVGTNDASNPPDHKHVDLVEYRANVERIILILREHNKNIVIILITPPPLGERTRNQRTHIAEYARSMRELARSHGTEVINLWAGRHFITPEDLHDGVHLNISGNKKIFEALRAIIVQKYPILVPAANVHYPVFYALKGMSFNESKYIIDSWVYTN